MSDRSKELMGKEAKDKVTGFVGIVTGRTTWLYGCDQYCLTPKMVKDGELNEAKWFDDGRIEVIGSGINAEDVRVEKNGGDNNHPSMSRR